MRARELYVLVFQQGGIKGDVYLLGLVVDITVNVQRPRHFYGNVNKLLYGMQILYVGIDVVAAVSLGDFWQSWC